MTVRTRAIGVLVVAGVMIGAGAGLAQQDAAAVVVLQVRPNFYMIATPVSNVGVQIGLDGVVVVNTGTQETSGEILSAIQKLTKAPIRYINTSADADLVGGNRTLSKAGLRLCALTIRS